MNPKHFCFGFFLGRTFGFHGIIVEFILSEAKGSLT